ncbi:quinone oxidoreductase [Flagelloscypha sp. PMI_526]|nr:quinone oxidoreductase [Flagelloscypha sp. PMI_526]
MRAVQITDGQGPASHMYISDVETPEPKASEVLVKREGKYPLPPGASTILGSIVSGEAVNSFKIGDEVFGLASGGAYAEYLTVPTANLLKKPAHLTFQTLVLIGGFSQGHDVLIHAGASGVGIAATQIARLLKGNKIITTTSSSAKLEALAKCRYGPSHGINYKTQNFADEVIKITESKGVDVVIDFIGADYLQKNLQALARDGPVGGEISNFDMAPILLKRLRIEGTTLRSRSAEYQADLVSRFARELLPHFTASDGSGPLHPIIHKSFSWKDIVKAHTEMESNANVGKIVGVID